MADVHSDDYYTVVAACRPLCVCCPPSLTRVSVGRRARLVATDGGWLGTSGGVSWNAKIQPSNRIPNILALACRLRHSCARFGMQCDSTPQVLGVSRQATEKEISNAYKKQALRWCPHFTATDATALEGRHHDDCSQAPRQEPGQQGEGRGMLQEGEPDRTEHATRIAPPATYNNRQ